MRYIKKAWKGEERLWMVFWLYNFLAGIILGTIMGVAPSENLVITTFFVVIWLIWAFWVAVSLWRCAFNAKWTGWGYITRAFVILLVLVSIANVFVTLGEVNGTV